MKIPSDISYIKKIINNVEKLLRSRNVSDSDVFDIRLCLEEAIKNSILHGNKGKRDRKVFISYTLKDNTFTAEIEDEGKGFDPSKLPDPTKDENLLREGGRGVFLIQKLMDQVEYKGRGNKVFMVKSITKSKGGVNAY